MLIDVIRTWRSITTSFTAFLFEGAAMQAVKIHSVVGVVILKQLPNYGIYVVPFFCTASLRYCGQMVNQLFSSLW